jgi:hypothetical protein
MKNTYRDPKTGKLITYSTDSKFKVYTRRGNNSPITKAVAPWNELAEILTAYHNLIIPTGTRKYLVHDRGYDTEILYSDKGYADPDTVEYKGRPKAKGKQWNLRISTVPEEMLNEIHKNFEQVTEAKDMPEFVKILLAHYLSCDYDEMRAIRVKGKSHYDRFRLLGGELM